MNHAKPGLVPHDVPGTPVRGSTRSDAGGYLPGDLASYYGHEADASHEGSGQTIGFVEFSNYRPRRLPNAFKACFSGPAITGTSGSPTSLVGSGPTNSNGQVEVNLDIEVAMGAARDATYTGLQGRQQPRARPDDVQPHARRTTSTSCPTAGACARCSCLPSSPLTENTSLELLAAGGSSLYVASGDNGSADCKSASPAFKFLAIDDPSSQPFATAVGGTNLKTVRRARDRLAGSGGGVSYNWPRPGYQATVTSNQNVNIPGAFCAGGTLKCRVTPDVAMDAAPAHGYLIFSHGLGGGGGSWGVVGGTSAAAPLMAGITADANESVGGASDLGFANPFIYNTNGTGLGPGDFTDIKTGQQQQRHRLALAGRRRLRHGDGPRLGQGRGVRGGARRVHAGR